MALLISTTTKLLAVARALTPMVGANTSRLLSSKPDDDKAPTPTYTYQYLPPGSSMSDAHYRVSVSDPDVHYYDQRNMAVGNPASRPGAGAAMGGTRGKLYRFPATKSTKYTISLSDPVYRTENDTKDP